MTAIRGVAIVVVLAAALLLVGRMRSDRTLENHLAEGKAYAAREFALIGTLPARLNETSGLAVSRTQPGVLWSHNDSGDAPNLYAIDASGKLLAVFPVSAQARDWEDMSSGPCPEDAPPGPESPPATSARSACLYLADIGDNDRVREALTVYVVAEPSLSAAGSESKVVPARSFRYRYPQGPDDAEALAVQPDGDVTIVTKGRSGAIGFFRLGREEVERALASGEILSAEYDGDTAIRPDAAISRLATGAAVSPDGTTLAVRTYYELYFFHAMKERGRVRWRVPGRRCFLGDAEPQGEAVDYLDREVLLLTSERSRHPSAVIHRVKC